MRTSTIRVLGVVVLLVVGCRDEPEIAAACEGSREVAAFAVNGLEGDAEGTAFMDDDSRSSMREALQRQLANTECFTDDELERMESVLE